MKLAVFSESSADEAAIRIIVEGILGIRTEPVALQSLRTRGWPSVRSVLPSVLNRLHYHTDAEALVIVVDSDNSSIHQQSHDGPDGADSKCRVCLLRDVINQTLKHVKKDSGRALLKTAVGLAIPAIEAWLLCGVDPHCTEAALIPKLGAGAKALKGKLKKDVYRTDRALDELKTRRATEEAMRLAQDLNLIEHLFPNGFGALARDVRNW